MSFISTYRKLAAGTPYESQLIQNITDDMTPSQISDTIRSNGECEFVEGICSGICDSAIYQTKKSTDEESLTQAIDRVLELFKTHAHIIKDVNVEMASALLDLKDAKLKHDTK